MKICACALLVSFCVSSAALTQEPSLAQRAEQMRALVEHRYAHGESSRLDVAQARLQELQIKRLTGVIEAAEFCARAPKIADEAVNLLEQSSRANTASPLDVMHAYREVAEVAAACKTSSH